MNKVLFLKNIIIIIIIIIIILLLLLSLLLLLLLLFCCAFTGLHFSGKLLRKTERIVGLDK